MGFYAGSTIIENTDRIDTSDDDSLRYKKNRILATDQDIGHAT